VPVAEAVIRACKTRTRPIVITALALVAGSSVIFTDPIFQGMAISLVVRCAGIDAADADRHSAGVRRGEQGPVRGRGRQRPAGNQRPLRRSLLEDEPPVASGGEASPPQGSSAVWERIGGVAMMLFYVIRAPFVLLFDSLKTKLGGREPAGAGAPAAFAGAGAGGGDTPTAADVEPQNALRSGAPSAAEPSGRTRSDDAGRTDGAQARQEVADDTSTGAEPRTADPTPETAAPAKSAAKTAQARKSGSDEAAKTKRKPSKVAKVQKKASRRGIRLKTDDTE
jgi:hypothetical protein